MGICCTSISVQEKPNKIKIIDYNFTHQILLIILGNLESIAFSISGQNNNISRKYPQNTIVNNLSLNEFTRIFKNHLLILKISKQQIERLYGEKQVYVFPINLSKKLVFQQIQYFQKVCQPHSNSKIAQLCDDFKNILEGNYTDLAINKNEDILNSQQISLKKSQFLKNAICAAICMNQKKQQIMKRAIDQNQNQFLSNKNSQKDNLVAQTVI